MELPVRLIERTAGTQVRARLDPEAIQDFTKAMKRGDKFPAVIVFAEDGSERYVLADGFHRVAAAEKADIEVVTAEVRQGKVHDALEFALRCNAEHGVRRTNADKNKAMKLALRDPIFKKLSLREVAELCNVSHEAVRQIKSNENVNGNSKDKDSKRKTKPAPSQEDIDRKDLLTAVKLIQSLPYDGKTGAQQLKITKTEALGLAYCVNWLDEAASQLLTEEEWPE
jgi:hypothetical protein